MEGIRKAMNEINLNEGQWEDRKQWSLGVGQRRKTFCNLYIYHTQTTELGDRNIGPIQEDCSGRFLRQFSIVNCSVTEVGYFE